MYTCLAATFYSRHQNVIIRGEKEAKFAKLWEKQKTSYRSELFNLSRKMLFLWG
jgi:hypothetical protein